VGLRDGVLTVHAESPVWANLLRNTEQSIISALRDSGLSEVRSLRVRIAPPKPAQESPQTEDQEADNPKLRRLFAQLRRALD
jgi:hypothetical protein